MGPEQPVPASEALVGGDEAMQVASKANAGEVIAQEPVEGQRAQNGGGGSRRGLVERQLRRSTRKAGSPLDHIAERVGGDGCRAESVDCGGGGAATGKRKGSEEQERQGGDHRSVFGRAEKRSTAKKKPVSQRKPREARLTQGFSNKEKGKTERDEDTVRRKENIRVEEKERERATQAKLRLQLEIGRKRVAEKEKERRKVTRLQHKEALERQHAEEESERQRQSAEELRIRLAAQLEENMMIKRKLVKERKRKEACRKLVDQLGDIHQRPRRKCSHPPDVAKIPPITAADARGYYAWAHEKVVCKKSKVAGNGLFSKGAVDRGQDVFAALLPDEPVESAFANADYSCYSHIMHADGQSALAIDPGRKMRGNVFACEADNDIRLLWLLNHSKSPNVEFSVGDAATPDWFEAIGGAEYGPWYTCSIKALENIEKGVELTIKYADAPAEWDV